MCGIRLVLATQKEQMTERNRMTRRKELRMFLTGLMMVITVMLLTPCQPAWATAPRVAAGAYHTVGLKADGTVVAVGWDGASQTNVSSWTDVTAVAAGYLHSVGLKSDGTVVGVGDNSSGQRDFSSWADLTITAIGAGHSHTVGLKSDSTVVAVGDNTSGQRDVSLWTSITAIAAGYFHTVGLKADGTVVAVGNNDYGQTDVSSWAGLIITAITAGHDHTVGLKPDGTVVAVGSNDNGQKDVSSWESIVAVAAGYYHTVGLKADGTVVAVGSNSSGQTNVSSWEDIVAIAAGGQHTVGLKSDGTVVAVGSNDYGQTDVSSWQLRNISIKGGMGTPVILKGFGFGFRKGTVHVGTAAVKVIAWYDTRIVFEMTGSLTAGEYPIYVKPREAATITYGKPFIMKAPELQFVRANEGYAGDMVVLTGRYFGSKKGKISLGARSCAISYWYTDPTDGESLAAFRIPPRLTPGNYNVTLTNEAGSAKFPAAAFTVKSGKPTSMNHEGSLSDSP
jgi:alpha-tubulin suppressor-like RCC1 family protein